MAKKKIGIFEIAIGVVVLYFFITSGVGSELFTQIPIIEAQESGVREYPALSIAPGRSAFVPRISITATKQIVDKDENMRIHYSGGFGGVRAVAVDGKVIPSGAIGHTLDSYCSMTGLDAKYPNYFVVAGPDANNFNFPPSEIPSWHIVTVHEYDVLVKSGVDLTRDKDAICNQFQTLTPATIDDAWNPGNLLPGILSTSVTDYPGHNPTAYITYKTNEGDCPVVTGQEDVVTDTFYPGSVISMNTLTLTPKRFCDQEPVRVRDIGAGDITKDHSGNYILRDGGSLSVGFGQLKFVTYVVDVETTGRQVSCQLQGDVYDPQIEDCNDDISLWFRPCEGRLVIDPSSPLFGTCIDVPPTCPSGTQWDETLQECAIPDKCTEQYGENVKWVDGLEGCGEFIRYNSFCGGNIGHFFVGSDACLGDAASEGDCSGTWTPNEQSYNVVEGPVECTFFPIQVDSSGDWVCDPDEPFSDCPPEACTISSTTVDAGHCLVPPSYDECSAGSSHRTALVNGFAQHYCQYDTPSCEVLKPGSTEIGGACTVPAAEVLLPTEITLQDVKKDLIVDAPSVRAGGVPIQVRVGDTVTTVVPKKGIPTNTLILGGIAILGGYMLFFSKKPLIKRRKK